VITDGDGDGDGEWLGLGLDASGVGTGGTGHRQLGSATGAAGAAGAVATAGRRDGGAECALTGTGAVTGASADPFGAGLVAAATGGTEAAREDRTPPNPLAIAAYAPPTNTNPATSSPPAARYRRPRTGCGWYASDWGCSTSVRRRDSGTGRVASYRSERHRPPSSRTSQPNPITLQPPSNSLHCRGAYRLAHGRLME